MILESINTNPVLLDKMVSNIQAILTNSLPWLNHAFGTSHKLNSDEDGKSVFFPAVYVNNGEYRSVLPDDILGNYSFIEFDDPQVYNSVISPRHMITVKGSLIVWFNLASIFSDKSMHRAEDIKKEVLDALLQPGVITSGRLSVLKVYQKPENIFRNYNIRQIDSQYLMYPYSGLRFECEFKVSNQC